MALNLDNGSEEKQDGNEGENDENDDDDEYPFGMTTSLKSPVLSFITEMRTLKRRD